MAVGDTPEALLQGPNVQGNPVVEIILKISIIYFFDTNIRRKTGPSVNLSMILVA